MCMYIHVFNRPCSLSYLHEHLGRGSLHWPWASGDPKEPTFALGGVSRSLRVPWYLQRRFFLGASIKEAGTRHSPQNYPSLHLLKGGTKRLLAGFGRCPVWRFSLMVQKKSPRENRENSPSWGLHLFRTCQYQNCFWGTFIFWGGDS